MMPNDKQKKSNRYAAITLGILLAISAILFFVTRESPSDINRDYFRIDGLEKIDQVEFKSGDGNVVLQFEDGRWRVNGKWDADAQMIKVLFATLQQMEPRRPVAAALRDSVRNELEQKGTVVSLFEKGQKRAAFLAGGNSLKTDAWIMKGSDSQPYVTVIPGYRVYVSGILEMKAGGWRNKRIFDFNWRNFKSLSTTYPGDQKQNFEIEMLEAIPSIKKMDAVDTAKLNSYLDDLSLLFATRFIAPGARADSLSNAVPAARIEIKDIGNRIYALELFSPRKKDVEIYGRIADEQMVTLAKSKVAAIMRKRDYFQLRPGS